jgi:hypothetical protein
MFILEKRPSQNAVLDLCHAGLAVILTMIAGGALVLLSKGTRLAIRTICGPTIWRFALSAGAGCWSPLISSRGPDCPLRICLLNIGARAYISSARFFGANDGLAVFRAALDFFRAMVGELLAVGYGR